jgi:hypothetical protein
MMNIYDRLDAINDFVESLDGEDFLELRRAAEYRVRSEADYLDGLDDEYLCREEQDLKYLRRHEQAREFIKFANYLLRLHPDNVRVVAYWLRLLVHMPDGIRCSMHVAEAYVKEQALQQPERT